MLPKTIFRTDRPTRQGSNIWMKRCATKPWVRVGRELLSATDGGTAAVARRESSRSRRGASTLSWRVTGCGPKMVVVVVASRCDRFIRFVPTNNNNAALLATVSRQETADAHTSATKSGVVLYSSGRVATWCVAVCSWTVAPKANVRT
jgi:hypothetical protein